MSRSRKQRRGKKSSVLPLRGVSRSGFILLALAIFTVLTAVVYRPVLGGRVPFPSTVVLQFPPWQSIRPPDMRFPRTEEMGDLGTQFYPWAAFLRTSLLRGSLPLWNPDIYMGMPFQAEPQTALFYPPHILYYVLKTKLAWSLGFILRVFLAGLLTVLVIRELGGNRIGALLAGIAFAFSGSVTAFQGRPQLDTSLWFGFVLFALSRLRKSPGLPNTSMTAIAFALPVLAGHPENALHVTILGCAFACYLFLSRRAEHVSEARGRFLQFFVLSGALAIGLSAVQILPTLEWLGQIRRSIETIWPARPIPEAVTFVSRDLGANPNLSGVAMPEGAGYAGMLVLLLAPLAFLNRKSSPTVFFTVTAALSLAVVYGVQPVFWLTQHIPVLRGMPNWRLLLEVNFLLAGLAGFAVTALCDAESIGEGTRLQWAVFTTAGVGVATALFFAWSRPFTTPSPVPARVMPVSGAFLFIASALLIALRLSRRIGGRAFGWTALCLASLDLVSAAYGVFPFVPAREVYPPAPLFDFLRTRGDDYRVAAVDAVYGTNFDMVYGVSSAVGYDFPLRRAAGLLAAVTNGSDGVTILSEKLGTGSRAILDLASVRYLVTTTDNSGADRVSRLPGMSVVFRDGATRVFENANALARAHFVPLAAARVVAVESEQLKAVLAHGFDAKNEVIVGASIPGGTPVRSVRPLLSRVLEFRQAINFVDARVDVHEPGILVFSQMFYPGWSAIVDGRETPLLRVNYAFTGVRVPEGAREVRLLYRPISFRAGAVISLISLLIIVSAWRPFRGVREEGSVAIEKLR